ncbi:50S ribosomal protein L25 [Myxococcota bacterium]|nr:50S ribosomal protein L25 [Myxococcota bacterium]
MECPVITAKARTVIGKGYARKIRALGYLPAVLYGGDRPNLPLVVDPKAIGNILRSPTGRNTLCRLVIQGDQPEETMVVVRDYLVHPVRRNLIHCDFLRVTEQTELEVKVPIRTVGKSVGERLGAKLSVTMHQVTIRCPVDRVPSEIVVDVSDFAVGHSVTISQLPLPEGARPVFIKDNAVITVRVPKAETEEAAAEGTTAAEGTAAPAAAATAEAKEPEKKK